MEKRKGKFFFTQKKKDKMEEKIMEEKIEFLKEYSLKGDIDIHIFKPSEIHEISENVIPGSWYSIFEKEDSDIRKSMIIDIWKKYSGENYRNTIQYLEERLADVELVKVDEKYSILYSVKSEDGEIQYYEGGNPLEPLNNEDLELIWSKVPISIREFYENIHNGFYDYASKAMGLISLESIVYFADDEWSIIEELDDPLQINLETTFGFFENGMGGYIAIDLENCNNDKATLWFSDDQPEYNLNFWDVVDEWTVIGLQDL